MLWLKWLKPAIWRGVFTGKPLENYWSKQPDLRAKGLNIENGYAGDDDYTNNDDDNDDDDDDDDDDNING